MLVKRNNCNIFESKVLRQLAMQLSLVSYGIDMEQFILRSSVSFSFSELDCERFPHTKTLFKDPGIASMSYIPTTSAIAKLFKF